MTTTPKPDVRELLRLVRNALAFALIAEASTMDLPDDHPYWTLPDDLRLDLHWERGPQRFVTRGEIARRLRGEHGWAVHFPDDGAPTMGPPDPSDMYEVRPPATPKVTHTPAREVAKRLIDGERVVVHEWGEVTAWRCQGDELGLGGNIAFALDSTVPVIEDGDR